MSQSSSFNGRLIADASIPIGMEIEAGSPFKKSWRLQNTGNQTWAQCRLVYVEGTLPTAVNWHMLPAAVPGQEIEMSISLSAPREPATYRSQWQMNDPSGNPFGPSLLVQIEVIPGGQNNGRMLSYSTNGDEGSGSVNGGETYSQTLVLENTGGRRWRADYQLAYLGGGLEPQQMVYNLPATIPGENNALTVTMKATAPAGITVSYWQMRDQNGVAFGGFIAPETRVLAAVQATQPFDPQAWRKVIWDITGIFESGRPGGNPAAYQNRDSGIVSYGAHQVTLASGNLGRVLALYFQNSNSPTSQALQNEYAARVNAIDQSLRNDTRFRDLLIQAANEPQMVQAQDDIFGEGFYNPAVAEAQRLGIRTPLGVACIYDTRIQHGAGGSTFLFGLTKDKIGGMIGEKDISESSWLAVFLDEREALLNRLADKSDRNGDTVSGNFLRTSTFRVRELRNLLTANNVGLTGQFAVRGQQITGL